MFFITTFKDMPCVSFDRNFRVFCYETQTWCQFILKHHIFVNFIIFLVITDKISVFISSNNQNKIFVIISDLKQNIVSERFEEVCFCFSSHFNFLFLF